MRTAQNEKRSVATKRRWAEGRYTGVVFGTQSRKGHRGASKGMTQEQNPKLARKWHGKGRPFDSVSGSKLRQAQLVHESAEAARLTASGYEVFSPTVVCDRVAIKDGKVYFVEFKKAGQRLREGQRKVCAVAPEQYLIVYSGK